MVSSNRTIKELKFKFWHVQTRDFISSNRTIKELKYRKRLEAVEYKRHFQSHHKGIEIYSKTLALTLKGTSNRTIKELKSFKFNGKSIDQFPSNRTIKELKSTTPTTRICCTVASNRTIKELNCTSNVVATNSHTKASKAYTGNQHQKPGLIGAFFGSTEKSTA
jgi:hypothetical protein